MKEAKISYDMPFSEYLALKGASKGALNKIASSTPIECYHYMYKEEKEEEQKRHLALGSLLHCAVLEPDKLAQAFLVAERPERRSNAGKQKYAELMELQRDTGKTWVSPEEFDQMVKMCAAINGHPLARKILSVGGNAEVTIQWEQSGVPCRARLDFLTDELPGFGRFVFDLKTSRDLSRVYRDHHDFGYDLQFVHYGRGAAAAGLDLAGFIFIFVDSSENVCPELVRVIDPAYDGLYVELAEKRYNYAFNRFRECWHSGKWPGYAQDNFEAMQYTSWHSREIEYLDD